VRASVSECDLAWVRVGRCGLPLRGRAAQRGGIITSFPASICHYRRVDPRFCNGVLPGHGRRRMPCKVLVNKNIRMTPMRDIPYSDIASVICDARP
jgi:hypothetical protein